MPVFSINPKLGTSLGVLGGYMHYFDEKSRPLHFRPYRPVLNHPFDRGRSAGQDFILRGPSTVDRRNGIRLRQE